MNNMTKIKPSSLKKQRKFSSTSRQQGWTMWSLMFIGGIVILFAYIGFQLVPVYTGNANIKNAMQIAIDRVSPNSISRAAIIKTMRTQLNLDGAKDSIDYNNDIGIKRTKRQLIITTNYESRVELFYNLSLVATFENEVTRDL